jgi:hypothetical protein
MVTDDSCYLSHGKALEFELIIDRGKQSRTNGRKGRNGTQRTERDKLGRDGTERDATEAEGTNAYSYICSFSRAILERNDDSR